MSRLFTTSSQFWGCPILALYCTFYPLILPIKYLMQSCSETYWKLTVKSDIFNKIRNCSWLNFIIKYLKWLSQFPPISNNFNIKIIIIMSKELLLSESPVWSDVSVKILRVTWGKGRIHHHMCINGPYKL